MDNVSPVANASGDIEVEVTQEELDLLTRMGWAEIEA